MNLANTFPVLLRRELWEHRSLWIAPLVWVGIIVVMFTWGTFQMTHDNDISEFASAASVEEIEGMSEHKREEISRAMNLDNERKQTVFAFSYLAIGGLISGFTCIVVFFYLIDCLFSERRDRSILFWKSLPVSDAQVVMSKFVTAMVVVPVGVLALSAVTQLVLLGIWNLRFGGTVIGALTPDWDILTWFRAQLLEGGIMLGALMWYAPIAAYFLVLSVWVKRLVFLWAVLPLIAAPLLEKVFLRSEHIALFLADRFGGYIRAMNIDHAGFQTPNHEGDLPRVQDIYDAFELSGMFTSLEAWAGLAAAAALLFLAIRIRRYRDES
jgi:ABC-2 type transport system permease protein